MIPEKALEKLNRKKVALVFEVKSNQEGFISFVIAFPIEEVKEQKYKSNLLPIVSYEIRYIKHKVMYTCNEWGNDYDHVLNDVTTRIQRIFVKRTDNNSELDKALSCFDIDLNDFTSLLLNNMDSALVNAPIDYYINHPELFPHL